MCGIVGYIGHRPTRTVLLDGLKRLEYRGYDSAGLAVIEHGRLNILRALGKVADLEAVLQGDRCAGTLGIAHTRWATHGAPSERNAHPHCDGEERIAVVHNGIIENHYALRKYLEDRGCTFRSETDTEVLAHLIAALGPGAHAEQ